MKRKILMNRRDLFVILISIFLCFSPAEAKKVKNSFKIEKEKNQNLKNVPKIEGLRLELADSVNCNDFRQKEIIEKLKGCSFAGYDKEPNSNRESFILINNFTSPLTGFNLRIDYLDMQGRMLHSRTITEPCYVPQGETRKFDIPSWDTQHTYYYYLGNEPKRVATPFQVRFTPLAFWIEE